ncbi:M13 family metallopeptidase [Roseivivax isoporae]|uniref:Peptidase M13 n=1 Tax=Roseivivax isoporae LMG 25204 TaxID=1449351 RepID=X7F2S0_9RHOB|nr:M13 family metallopeptidase [Roseivivax isoporae]ETX27070.1 hypothetical protein RISW2_16815 [Roseivivax isoporae LMG 25204]
MPFRRAALTPFASGLLVTSIAAAAPLAAGERAAPTPDELAFSVENMDLSVDPRVDFGRYAGGAWLDRNERPDTLVEWGIFQTLGARNKAIMADLLAAAGRNADIAAPGSPEAQVGTVYNAYMDVAARDAAGIAPLQPHLDAVAAVRSRDDLARLIGHFARTTAAPALLLRVGPDIDFADSRSYAMFASSGTFGLTFEDVLEEPPGAPRLEAYRAYLRQVMEIAGRSPAEAARLADLAVAIEVELHAGELSPLEANDPALINNVMPLDALQAQIPELDLSLVFEAMGYAAPDTVTVPEPRYFPVLSRVLRERSLEDLKDYAAVSLVVGYSGVLTTAFDEPGRALGEALLGTSTLEPLGDRAFALIAGVLGHPVGQIFVAATFTEADKAAATDMIARVREVFARRIPTRAWLSEPTRAAAAEKLDAFTIRVGYPDTWLDYSGVEIGSDLVANVDNAVAFRKDLQHARFGGPVVFDAFSDPSATLPTVVNAGYNPQLNGFEIPAAILLPPMFDAGGDPAVNFCRIGAVIGHEMTHGFDSFGRAFDAKGSIADWWTPEDTAAFTAETRKLVAQTDAFEVLPGLFGNGALEVTENLADVGGLTLAHEALRGYLADHPEADVTIDGLTPDQRCFVSWSQTWTAEVAENFLRSITATDAHAAPAYRAVAPLQHLPAFYEAFGIVEGDPMWLAPEKRVNIW